MKLKARVRATYGLDPDDPTPNQVTSSLIRSDGTLTVSLDGAPAIRLDLGAGRRVRAGFIAMGRDYGTEIFPLAYRDDSVDEIVASHVLEHFPHSQVQAVVRDWARALKPGGRMRLAVPDFGLLALDYLSGSIGTVERIVMGGQIDANDFHRSIFDDDRLRRLMMLAGLIDIKPWESEIADSARESVSLNLEGRKPCLAVIG
jgi:SAM-dependent methyltransferase